MRTTISLSFMAAFCAAFTPAHAFQAVHRPLSDFLNAQGSTTCYAPPAPDQLGFFSAADKPPVVFALMDYTGKTAQALNPYGISLGTTVAGTVLERSLANGRALVTINLHTKNALTWAINLDLDGPPTQFNSNPLLFGWRAQDLIGDPTRRPALGDQHLQIVFTNAAPGAPLPDLTCGEADGFCPNRPPCPAGFGIDELKTEATANGPLHAIAGLGPEGTPGRLSITQIGPLKAAARNGGKGALADGFPVERVELRQSGK